MSQRQESRLTPPLLTLNFEKDPPMAGKNQHVVPRDDAWAVRGAGNSRDTSHHRTQAEAERAAREIAINQKSEVLVHGEDGRIRERNSYGNDPYPPKG